MAGLKQCVKQILVNKQHRAYDREVKARNLSYDRWIREKEDKLGIEESISEQNARSLTNDFLTTVFEGKYKKNEGNNSDFDDFCRKFEIEQRNFTVVSPELFSLPVNIRFWKNLNTDVILMPFYYGNISRIALKFICREFKNNKNLILIYGDEDVVKKDENQRMVRTEPWLKPDWSPDRFLSSFYFGGLIAVRTEAFQEALGYCEREEVPEAETDARSFCYRILFEMIRLHNGFSKGHKEDGVPVCHVRQILFHSMEIGYEQIKDLRLLLAEEKLKEEIYKDVAEAQKEDEGVLLSVIIPSKDNPEVLLSCIHSILARTRTAYRYEILVVDNGSSEENKRAIMEKLSALPETAGMKGCRYLYQPMPFNFSKMCNLGAKEAGGNLLLFLNDDMEVIQPDWMSLMLEKARLPYVGGVGAKLLYPDSEVIQHAGITNLRVGPAHKLQFLDDGKVHYYGMNRGVHNMLGATGACLMMRREVFEEAGGFREELAVAFNDVDLCYTIYENGYYNVVRNDVVLYHHESLSRGKDGESEEKQLRLLREKDILYERHQELYGKDPFYHPYLTMDMLESEYSPAYRYEVTIDMPWAEASLCTKEVLSAREDRCLVVGMECAMDLYKWQYGVSPDKGEVKISSDEMGYYFQGYSFVIGADNACYKKTLLLKNKEFGEVWGIALARRYRQDIKENLKDQLNVDLTGYAAKLRKKILSPGVYQFGMLAVDQCSRQKLVNWSNWVLEVDTDE